MANSKTCALLLVSGVLAACGSSPNKGAQMASAAPNAAPAPLVNREKCNEQGKHVVTADTNEDKKPDVWKFFKSVDLGGQKTDVLVCKQSDLNHDGKIDLVNYYDDRGAALEMEEADLDQDGKFDMTVYYSSGKRVRDEKDMNFDQRVDVWKFYEEEKLVREEHDKNSDGRVDEWHYYEAGKLDRIGYDTTGSGRVDKWDRAPERDEDVPGGADTAAGRGSGDDPASGHDAARGRRGARRPRCRREGGRTSGPRARLEDRGCEEVSRRRTGTPLAWRLPPPARFLSTARLLVRRSARLRAGRTVAPSCAATAARGFFPARSLWLETGTKLRAGKKL